MRNVAVGGFSIALLEFMFNIRNGTFQREGRGPNMNSIPVMPQLMFIWRSGSHKLNKHELKIRGLIH